MRNWLKDNANNPNIPEIDKAAAQNVLKDLNNEVVPGGTARAADDEMIGQPSVANQPTILHNQILDDLGPTRNPNPNVEIGPNEMVRLTPEQSLQSRSNGTGDRSGLTQKQWRATAKYWENLGYRVNVIPLGER